MNKQSVVTLLLTGLICYLLIVAPGTGGFWLSPVVMMLLTGLIAFRMLRHLPVSTEQQISFNNNSNTFSLVLFALFAVATMAWASRIFDANPIDVGKSDIIPLMRDVYYQRLANGEYVYATLTGWGYGEWTPNYLPMHWLPLVPAFALHTDPRFMVLAVFLIAIFSYVRMILRQQVSFLEKGMKTSLPFLLLFGLFHHQPASIAHTVELMPAGFYMLLVSGLISNNRLLTVAGISTTLLSRYVSLFFLPIDAYTRFREKSKKTIFIYLGVLMVLSGLYFIPFLMRDPGIFTEGARAYDVAALGEWSGQSWQNKGDLPYQLFQGYGFASWFYLKAPGTLLQKIGWLKMTLLLVMALHALFMIMLYRRIKPHPLFRAIACWTTLCCFLLFVLVPYSYLYWSYLFVMLVLIAQYPWMRTTDRSE